MKTAVAALLVLGLFACKKDEAKKDVAKTDDPVVALDAAAAKVEAKTPATDAGGATTTPVVPTGDTQDKLLADATAMKDTMCACKDIGCLDKEEAHMKELGARIEAMFPDIDKVPEVVMTTLSGLEDEVQQCALEIAEATPLTGDGAAEAETVLAGFGKVRDAVCACKDMACAQEAMKDGEALDAKLKEIYPGEPPPAVLARFDAIIKGFSVCLERIAPQGPAPMP